MEKARKGQWKCLKENKKQALRQTEGIQAHLEQKRAEVMRTLAEINKVSRRKSDIDFLQVENI